MTSKPNDLKHPIRDGFGFLAAAAMAVVQLFTPTSRRSADAAKQEAAEDPESGGLKKRVAPYPVED